MALLDLLEREAPRLLHEVDEAEVSGPEHDHVAVRDVVLRALLRRMPGRVRQRMADHRVLLVAARDPGDLAGREGALDELVEPVAVALLERRPLRLAVIGEHDDLVRAGCVAASTVDPGELLVELPERLERVGPLQPGVVGHLVVAGEGRVDRGPSPHHVGQDAEDDEVAHDHAHRAAQERVDPAPVSARVDVPPDRSQRRGPLEDDLPEEEDERPRDVVSVCEERAVAGVRTLLGVHAAHGEDDVVGLAREEVPAARATVGQKTVPRVPALDLRAVGRRRAGHHDRALLLDPAERRDVLVGAEQDARLARSRLGREIGLPFEEPMRVLREPARHRRRVAVPHRALEDGTGEPVDLEVDDARRVGADLLAGATRDPLDHPDRVRVVVVRAQDDLEHDRDRRDEEGGEDCRSDSADVDRVRERAGREHGERVEEEDEEERRRDRVREAERGDDGSDHGVDEADDDRGSERGPPVAELESGQDQRREEERGGADGEPEQEPRDMELRADVGAARHLAVPVRFSGRGAHPVTAWRRARRMPSD